MSGLGFPISTGPSIGNVGISDFAQGVYRPNRVTDQITNGQIVYHYILLPEASDANRLADIGVAMLCFGRQRYTRIKDNVSGFKMRDPKRLRITGHTRPEISIEAFEVSHLNFFMWEDSLLPNNRHQYYSEASAAKIAQEFVLLGVVLNEAASNGSTDRSIRGENRVVNFVTGGRCQTFNLWEPEGMDGWGRSESKLTGAVPAGCSLWFILKRVHINRSGEDRYPWQFVPFVADRWKKPTVANLSWKFQGCTNPSIKSGVGVPIYVGTIGSVVGDVPLNFSTRITDQPFYHSLARPTAEVFLGV